MSAGVFLFGANSMLGWSIWCGRGGTEAVAGAWAEVTPFCNGNTRVMPDGMERGVHLDDELAVSQLIAEERPRLIVHCAGVCDVAACESSPEFAYSVNVDGTRILLDYAPADCRIVYCSSDHVFGGDGGAEAGPYAEDTATAPISVYGRTRVAAEKLVLARANTLVVRSGLWIGPSSNGKIGHLDWLRDRHRRGLPMTVVGDEVRSAVWAEDAARRVWALAQSEVCGVRHIVATRAVARPELAAAVNERFGIGARWQVEGRAVRKTPHLGNVELATRYAGALAAALPSPLAG